VFRKIGRVAKVAFAIIAVAAGAIFVKSIKAAADFEFAMAKVKAITGATAEEFDALTDEAKRLGLETAQTMTDIAAGMEALGRAGFEADEIISAMGGVVALAESQTMELGEAARITATTIRQMGLEAADADRVVNLLAATASSSNTTVESLAQSMKFFAPIAHAMGMSVEETVAAVGKLGDAGLTGGIATRALQTSLQGLARPTTEAAEMMDNLGISMFNTEGNFVGLEGAMAQIEVAFAGLTQEEQLNAMATIFGTGAVKQFSNLLGVGSEELARYTEEITGTTKAFDQQAEMLDTLRGQWTILKGSLELLLVTIGTDMMPILQSFLQDRVIPLVNGITNWIDEMGGLTGVIGHVKDKIREWADEHPLLNSAIQSLWDILSGIGSFLKNVYQKDWAAAWENIKGIVAAAGKFIAEAMTTLWNALPISDETKDKIVSAFIWIKDKAVEAWEGIKASVEEHGAGIVAAWDSLKAAAVDLWAAMQDASARIREAFGMTGESAVTFGDVVKGIFDVLLIIVTTAIGGIADIFDIFSSLLRGDWSQAWTDFKDFIAGIWEGIERILDVTGLWDIGVRMAHAIRDGVSSAWDTVVDWFKGAWDGLINSLTSWMPDLLKTWLGIGEDSAKAYADGLDAQKGTAQNAGQELGESAIEGARMTAEEMEIAGNELAESFTGGFSSGVDDGKEGAFTAGSEFGEAAIDGLSFGIDAQSPSKKAYRLGNDFTQGFGNGIADGTPEVVATVETMADAAVETLNDMNKRAKEAAEVVTDSLSSTWSALSDLVGDTLGSMLQGVFDYYRDKEQAAEDHAETMLDIQETYEEKSQDLSGDYQDDMASTQLTYDRKVEDINTDHRRDVAALEADDYDGRARVEARYQERLVDAATTHARRREDIESGYTRAITDLGDDVEEAKADEIQAYEDAQKTIGEVLWEMISLAVKAAAQELWILAAVEGAKALAYGAAALIPLNATWAGPLAAGHGAAAATAAGEALILDAGAYFAGFGEGAVFTEPTMLPPHMIAERGVEEAYLPLTRNVLGKIGAGIVDALSPQQPALAAAGNVTIDMRGMNEGAVFNVRSDQDAELIARENYNLFQSRLRSEGVRSE